MWRGVTLNRTIPAAHVLMVTAERNKPILRALIWCSYVNQYKSKCAQRINYPLKCQVDASLNFRYVWSGKRKANDSLDTQNYYWLG